MAARPSFISRSMLLRGGSLAVGEALVSICFDADYAASPRLRAVPFRMFAEERRLEAARGCARV